jgi:hypothetical protein
MTAPPPMTFVAAPGAGVDASDRNPARNRLWEAEPRSANPFADGT